MRAAARRRSERRRTKTQKRLAPILRWLAKGDDRNARVLMMAQRTADDHMRDAQRESEALIGNARDKADQITSEAELKAGTIESDARRTHSEALNSIGAKRAALLDEIDRLGQLAQSYHAALNSHVTQQLQELNSVPDAPH